MRESIDTIERKILQVLESVGDKGIMQRELWKHIGIDSRSGVRILARLERMGLIERERTTYKGKTTYIVKLPRKAYMRIRIPDYLRDVPCFSCPYIDVCGEGSSLTPERCERLLEWLKSKAEGREDGYQD